jgi:tetratricopeptide (TPR) repeat protein
VPEPNTRLSAAIRDAWSQHRAGRSSQAEAAIRAVLARAPEHAEGWCYLGMVLHDQRQFDAAAGAYESALRLKPAFAEAWSNLANTRIQQGRLAEAEACCVQALAARPDYVTALINLAAARHAGGHALAAAAALDRALRLEPKHAAARIHLQAVLRRLAQSDLAVAYRDDANLPAYFNNWGAAALQAGEFDAATEAFNHVIELLDASSTDPNLAEAHKNRACILLLRGDFARGWAEYEWRWRFHAASAPKIAAPRWNGEPLAGRSLLLHFEQGLGDTLMFARYGREFQRCGAHVVLYCQAALRPLLAHCAGFDAVFASGDAVPACDYWLPLLSIPAALGETAVSPASAPYLCADAARVAHWRKRLASGGKLRVAIAWQGNRQYRYDSERSIALREFAPLARVPGVSLVSVQKGPGSEQIEANASAFPLTHFGADLDAGGAFLDSAAILSCVDLLICSDSALVHLAGALGTPAWLALPAVPDWRWQLERDDSPWYPNLRLFRQGRPGHWAEVFRRMSEVLALRLGAAP